jgi:uncharacterized protein YbbK (DUF523 family)
MNNEGIEQGKVLVSACLVGVHTQWNGECSKNDDIVALVRSGRAVFLCPEQLGGLTTPREPSEIEPGKTATDVLAGSAKVVARTGQDVTGQFVGGAQEVLAFCQAFGIETAILKARSPSCGSSRTYDGTFSETTRPGRGITAELLEQNGIVVYSEENLRDSFAL